jgi:hypothetical protein
MIHAIILLAIAIINVHAQFADIVLEEVQLYQPPITQCVNPDIMSGPTIVFTECGTRSEGCIYTNLNCKLSTGLGYTLNPNFMSITPILMSALDPVTQDAKINFTISYATQSIFSVQGVMQLWQFSNIDPISGVNNYVFANRQMYINQPIPATPGQYPIYTFNDLYSGKYVLVYWDNGGTVYGTGAPEMSDPFNVLSVFPMPVALKVQPMLQTEDFDQPTQCIDVNFATANMWIEYPYSKYYNMAKDKSIYFSYELMGVYENFDLQPYIDNAPSVHNRKFVWEHRTDQGNILNVKTEPLPPTTGYYICSYCDPVVDMAALCNRCANEPSFYIPACDSCAYPSPTFCSFCSSIIIIPISNEKICADARTIQIDSMLRYKFSPMSTGSYGEATGAAPVPDVPPPTFTANAGNPNGYLPWNRLTQGRKSLVSVRLAYVGIDNYEYGDYWYMRQGFGAATMVAGQVLDMVQVEATAAYAYFPPETSPGPTTGPAYSPLPFGVYMYNHFEVAAPNPKVHGAAPNPPGGAITEMLFVTYFFAQHPRYFGFGGALGLIGQALDYYGVFDQMYDNQNWNTNIPQNGYGYPSTGYCNGKPGNSGNCDVTANGHYCKAPYCMLSGTQLFRFLISFVEHENTDDSMCFPTGTVYAHDVESGKFVKGLQSWFNPQVDEIPQSGVYGPNADYFTLADVQFGTEYVKGFTDECTAKCDAPAGSFYSPIGCGGPLTHPNPPTPSCCSPTDLSGTYPVNPADGTCNYPSLAEILVYRPNGCYDNGVPECCAYSNWYPPSLGSSLPSYGFSTDCFVCEARMFATFNYASGNTYSCAFGCGGVGDTICPGYLCSHSTGMTRVDTMCGNGGGVGGALNTLNILHIGATMQCDAAIMLSGTNWGGNIGIFNGLTGYINNGVFGTNNADASNNGDPNQFKSQPPAVNRYQLGAIKDCAAGPFPNMYVNGHQRINEGRFSPTLSYPYYQTKLTYPDRASMYQDSDHIQQPVFLISGYKDSSGTIGRTYQALTLARPWIFTSNAGLGISPSVGESTSYLGLDTHTISIQYQSLYENGNHNTDYSFTVDQNSQIFNQQVQITNTYARFKVYPLITFRAFSNAVPARGNLPASIDVEFRVSCPFLQFYQYGAASTPAYCAEGWYITNQLGQAITLGIPIEGQALGNTFAPDSDPLSIAAYRSLVPGPSGSPMNNQILAPAFSDQVFIITIAYENNDVLSWGFNLRIESEKPYYLNPYGTCLYKTSDLRAGVPSTKSYVPDTVTVGVPPQQYVFMPMLARIVIAPPACTYNSPEMLIYVVRGTFYTWRNILELNLNGLGVNGQPVGVGINTQFVYYYYKWTLIGQGETGGNVIIQGFEQQFQLYSPPFTAMVCDVFTCISPAIPPYSTPAATNVNPLRRPPSCTYETINNATCPISLADPNSYAGINQDAFCTAAPDGRMVNAILFSPRLVTNPPYTVLYNIRSYFFNITTAYVDPLFFAQQYAGFYEQQNQFVITEETVPSGQCDISLFVQYGLSPESILESSCYENMIQHAIITSSFVVSLGSVQLVTGCSRPDNCCYFLPLYVSGTSPYTGYPVTLSGVSAPYIGAGNASDACFGTPQCLFEVIVSPPYNSNGGLCLGIPYSFTVQSPTALVGTREAAPTAQGNNTIYNVSAFHYPWRCPTVFTYQMPVAGFSPMQIETIPGPCNQPGTDAIFTFEYTDPACEGPISAANPITRCRLNMYFALANVNGDPTYPNSAPPGTGFSLGHPYLIDGIYSFTYNAEGQFEFPNFFTPSPQLPFGGFPPIPNGYWNAYFWVQPLNTTSANGFNTVQNAQHKSTAQVIASLAGVGGLTVVRTTLIRPQCAVCLNSPPIQISFTVNDLAYRGYYTTYFTDPVNNVLYAQNYTCAGFPCTGAPGIPCIDIDPAAALLANPAERQAACDLTMQATGIVIAINISTGCAASTFTPGAYTINVGAEGSTCGAQYSEFMSPLLPLTVQIECVPVTCSGGRNGNVNTAVLWGTPFPYLPSRMVQGSHLDVWNPVYNYSWSTPQGPLTSPSLLRVPEGLYVLNVTDANGCMAPPVSCIVGARSVNMTLYPINQKTGNCSGDPGEIQFGVKGGVPPYALEVIGGENVIVGSGWTVVGDSSVVASVNTTYVVVDSLGCVSPEVSFTLGGPINFQLGVSVDFYPCATQTATGRILAIVSPPGLGTVLVWRNLNTGQVVYDNSGNFGYPYLDNAPAGTYSVTATSVLYGCVKTAYVNLQARTLPIITFNRVSSSTSTDTVTGNIVSDNGPPYVITFFGMPTNLPSNMQYRLSTSLLGQSEIFAITNLLCTVTFDMTVSDRGNCTSTVTSYGRTVTIIDILNSPTPIPHKPYNQSEQIKVLSARKPRQNTKFFLVILVVGAVALMAFMLAWIIRSRAITEGDGFDRRKDSIGRRNSQ